MKARGEPRSAGPSSAPERPARLTSRKTGPSPPWQQADLPDLSLCHRHAARHPTAHPGGYSRVYHRSAGHAPRSAWAGVCRRISRSECQRRRMWPTAGPAGSRPCVQARSTRGATRLIAAEVCTTGLGAPWLRSIAAGCRWPRRLPRPGVP